MAEASCPRAARYVLRVRGRVGSGHQGLRACGGLHRQYLAEPLADVHVRQVTSARLCLEAGRRGPIGDEGHEASDSIGTLHFAHWVPFEHNHLGFFTIYDGDFEKYIQDFADKTSFVFDAVFPHVDGRAANPGREERPGVLSVGTGQQLSADRVLQRLSRPLGPRHPSPPRRSRSHHRPPLDRAGVIWSRTDDQARVRRSATGVQLTSRTGDEAPGASSPVAWSTAG